MGSRESGSDNRRSGGDGNGSSAFFNLVIDSSDERSQVGVLHVVGEDKQRNPRGGAREVIRRGEVIALSIDYDGVPASASEGEAKRIGCTHALTCVVQNQRGEQVLRTR